MAGRGPSACGRYGMLVLSLLVLLATANAGFLHSAAAECAKAHRWWSLAETLAECGTVAFAAMAIGRLAAIALVPLFAWLVVALGIEIFLKTHFAGDLDTWGGEWLMVLANSSPQEIGEFLRESMSVSDWSVAAALCGVFVLGTVSSVRLGRGARDRRTLFGFLAGIAAMTAFPLLDAPYCEALGTAILDHSFAESPFELSCYREISDAGKPIAAGEYRADAECPLVTIVIGESASRGHLSLYGYGRKTTPRADSMRERLVVFGDVGSDAWLTTESLLGWLTDHDSSNGIPGKVSLPAMARSAGLPTVLVSNQNHWGHVDGADVLLFRACASKTYLSDTHPPSRYDDAVLPEVAAAVEGMPGGGLLLVHLLGSHRIFGERYPKDFPFAFAAGTGRVDDYDRSIAYTDYVWDEIVKTVAARHGDAAVVYFSDHGEVPGLEVRKDCGEVREVPFFVWFSPEFSRRHPQVVADFVRAAGLPHNAGGMLPLLAELLGLGRAVK